MVGAVHVPDADVIAFAFGIAYEDAWGHRGASHSFAFAALVAGAALLWARRFALPPVKTAILSALVVTSHPLLDTMTDGGLGCALFWPVDPTRYFAPWRPIPVSPIGLAFLSRRRVCRGTEAILFAPLFVYALRPATQVRRARVRVLLAFVWFAAVWLIGLPDPLRQRLVGAVLRGQTEYSAGFSERAFASVKSGMTEAEVLTLLGPPLEEWLQYMDGPNECRIVVLEEGRVVRWPNYDSCTPPGITLEMTSDAVRQIVGSPPGALWTYSRSDGGRPFQARAVWFEDGKVFDVMRGWRPGQDRLSSAAMSAECAAHGATRRTAVECPSITRCCLIVGPIW